MEIYLDANATTPVLPEARAAAIAAMSADYGNPSSIHGTGLKARALMDEVRARARRVLGAPTGELLFMSGATEGIQTAVLSALTALRKRRESGEPMPQLLLYGATEHKAVPEALRHWNDLLRLNLQILAIPVGPDGRHDLQWLRERAPRAGLVCTMAANNETGIISDLDGIQTALTGSPALWMVDSVQALGKLPLRLADRPIDYAPFSGHKLYAPKGIGLLYVRAGAPITPLMAGGGQEGALRSGTENMPGIAALGAVLELLETGDLFKSANELHACGERLKSALRDAFPQIVFNADRAPCLPTTLNFSVPGVSSKVLLDLFDAANIRVSGGSACGASKAKPSYVLEAMGLDAWRCASAVRLSFGPATPSGLIDEACERIRACGASLRDSCLTQTFQRNAMPVERINRYVVDGSVCYLIADSSSRRCVIIDPLPQLTQQLVQWIRCRSYILTAVLDTHSHGDHASSATDIWRGIPAVLADTTDFRDRDSLGWPLGSQEIHLGEQRLSRLHIPGHTRDSTAYLLHDANGLCAAFVGDTVMPGALGRSDFDVSEPQKYGPSLKHLLAVVGSDALLLPGHDYDERYACTLGIEIARQPLVASVLKGSMDAKSFAAAKAHLERDLAPTEYETLACGARVDACRETASVELKPSELFARIDRGERFVLVDVREPYEHRLGVAPQLGEQVRREAVPLSSIVNAIPGWLAAETDATLVLFCRSGNRSAKAAQALRRLGLERTVSLAGGVALWPEPKQASRHAVSA
ncbi:aminotransferase class V-fold PLP-dependent enzyme [Roseateles cellulosilyticus]|uniref:cysteine desulfurase n=1 Tax=Pelomonas cellulosilytica TaxID=2906762 RepID=A0ABS8Y0W7_9BURK|nr:aminotransferase class V-fold PLP-dependent enzyme [Pelomonas sp. P8]MCE4556664.1 aminotransferase class V-fold PLP-dependent enzyme [Pelomonas sp. P8]